MKLTATMIAAFAALLYLILKALRPDLPIDENTLYQIIFWIISALLGINVEPFIRELLVNAGMKGFLPGPNHPNVFPDKSAKG
jgi:hypothetical protein